MNMRDLIPWGRSMSQAPTLYRDTDQSPFVSLHREMNRLFDETFRGMNMPASFGRMSGWATNWPSLEIAETDSDIRIVAEVPGLEEKDVEVLLEGEALTLRGEKRAEVEDKERQFSERFYGRFERSIPLGYEVEADKVKADFKNGLLTINLPKTAKAQARAKRIAINGGTKENTKH
jgi:HSP20 family protein